MKEKKEKKNWGLIFFLVFIMIGTSFSFVFFGFSPVADTVKYNGLKFVRIQDRWEAKINGRTAAFSFLPTEVNHINISSDIGGKLQNRLEIDVTYDFNSTFAQSVAIAQHQMGLTLEQYNTFIRKGFIRNNTFNLPVITCNESTLAVPVIYFKQGNTTNIHTEDNCIIAEASSNADFIRVKDRLLYGILGVIK